MTQRTFVIAECCSAWRFGEDHLKNAFRMIEAAHKVGADAAKFQWCSDPVEMSKRRNDNEPKNYEILSYPFEWLLNLKAKCDSVGIEFMVTAFIEKDIPTIAPLVKRFKVASAESSDQAFVKAHFKFDKPLLVSYAFGSWKYGYWDEESGIDYNERISELLCVCAYPTPVDSANLKRIVGKFDGLSDHTTSTLTGALAVAAGATIVEVHAKLDETPQDNPDYPHSRNISQLTEYVRNIRIAEVAMGDGENRMMPCEEKNTVRRVNG